MSRSGIGFPLVINVHDPHQSVISRVSLSDSCQGPVTSSNGIILQVNYFSDLEVMSLVQPFRSFVEALKVSTFSFNPQVLC